MNALARDLGYTPLHLDRAATDNSRRIAALARAREARRAYFVLASFCKRQPWTAGQRVFGDCDAYGDRRDGYQERDLAREEWRERIWEMNRRTT